MGKKNRNRKGSGPTCDCYSTSASQNYDGNSAGDKNRYKAMVLACIDPRMQKPVFKYLKARNLIGKYSQFTIAGGAVGAVAPACEAWHRTFWDNLSTSLELHQIRKVIVIQHRDCGAARAAYGYFERKTKAETRLHRAVLKEFREQLRQRHPQLKVEAILMRTNGSFKEIP